MALVLGFEVVRGDAGKVGNDDVIGASFAREVSKVAERLRLRLAQVLAETLVLHEHDAGPEQINVAVVAGEFLRVRWCALG